MVWMLEAMGHQDTSRLEHGDRLVQAELAKGERDYALDQPCAALRCRPIAAEGTHDCTGTYSLASGATIPAIKAGFTITITYD